MMNIRLILFMVLSVTMLSGCFTTFTGIGKSGDGEYYITTITEVSNGYQNGSYNVPGLKKCKSKTNGDLDCRFVSGSSSY